MTLLRRETSQASMASPHTVAVLRRTDGTWSPVTEGEAVLPREPIRLYAADTSWSVHFRLEDGAGNVLLDQAAGRRLAYADGWLDIAAPVQEGTYTAYAVDSDWPWAFPRHEVSVGFRVSASAPEPIPPPPPPAGGGPLEWLREGRNVLILLAVVAVILYVPKPRR